MLAGYYSSTAWTDAPPAYGWREGGAPGPAGVPYVDDYGQGGYQQEHPYPYGQYGQPEQPYSAPHPVQYPAQYSAPPHMRQQQGPGQRRQADYR